MNADKEIFVSVDIEASGPIPGKYSMLSIGACLTSNPKEQFSCYLKPISEEFVSAALEVTGLSLDKLRKEGLEPAEAMSKFKAWVESLTGADRSVVFVGFNASFDWSFVNYYFHQYLGENPFGIAALDIKSMFFGTAQCTWKSTRSSEIEKVVSPESSGNHDALDDAVYQAELFNLIREKLVASKRS
ncbi:3'-5' exonuclease [Pseudomonas simiae]|uniref:3'-5' exonuclease n=1 Tax=Pseudomonas simiae TaxID=321846 RepID=A0ABS9GAS6_9PSED|nr:MULTISPECIES: 3'-5' exonuclease [Pseudomonas]MCF5049896.1 3'-5' exonuclease [Pseudomonas simiae]MCF5170680.1 3'-5' exonuclease [Pseudomonas canadensis]MCF5188322.1 3'-5' exonuclease [Pseudomonas simiae]MCF5288684.1 3'-5' exonuclease [Pseudomonas simiae]MCF5320666.1 3'-5' exonuclease [Pseudomonas simiae]